MMKRSLFFWLLCALMLPAFDTATPLAPSAAMAQEQEEEFEDREEEFEEEEFDEEDFDDDEDEDEEVAEFLMEIRGELVEKAEELARAQKVTQKRIQKIDRFIELTYTARELEELMVAAEESDDDERIGELEEQFQQVEIEMDARRELLEMEGELIELNEQIEEADREEDLDRLELLEQLRDGFFEIGEIVEALIPIYLNGPESEEGPLEERKARVFTLKIEKSYRALQVLERLRDAEEEEDYELVKELEAQLNKLRSDSGAKSKTTAKPVVPELLPVVVTEETLAPFANADLQKDVVPLLKQYCFDCHSDDSSSGELNLEKLLATTPIVKNRDQWINVIEQSKNHVMPPEDGDQPTQEERAKIVLSLHNAVHKFDYSNIVDPGYESARRMSHREYSNTVRDLFGIDIDVIDRFPTDLTATSGFDNSANSLFIQPLLMERYLGIAEHVVTTALPTNATTKSQQAAKQRIYGGITGRDSRAARELLSRFLQRAYRRPPTDAEVDRFVSQFDRLSEDGVDFESAIRATLQAVIITPSFLLLTERDNPDTDEAFELNDWELASRLSYFLWASMPDDELYELAAAGKLRDAGQLTAQVSRMLADAKADTLGSVFTAQWLGSQHLGTRVRMDPIDNPWCTDSLMAAMRDETAMFFNSVVRENRPVTQLVDADYTFMNEELAKHYRIDGIKGEQMQRVSIDPRRRGGIFGQGALLAVTAFPGRTSPVVRGKWVLDNVLGTPPPPPPPNVSELSDEVAENRRLSFREKLELHREKPNCYACHSQMDPLGFSLEQFDWFGRYRTRQGRRRIDPTGQLPNGTEFVGLQGLKKVVVEQRSDDLLRQVSQKMLSYALGRQLEYYDEPAIRKIVDAVRADELRMQTVIAEIVKSYPFRYKKSRDSANLAGDTPTNNTTASR